MAVQSPRLPLPQRVRPLLTPAFRAWWRLSRGMTLGVRCLAYDSENRIALIRHSYMPGWHLPGGGVESGETLQAAAEKELREEAGLTPLAPPRLFGVYANHANFKNDHIALFVVDAFESTPFEPNGEIAELGFYPRDRLPQDVTRATRARIAEVFENVPVSVHW